MADYLPEHVIVKIIERLPTKSLIRFTSVSKWWRSIILSDPHFARSQFQIASQRQTLNQRILFPTTSVSEFPSLDVDALPPRSSLTEISCPFTQHVRLLCSCNGLVLALLGDQESTMFLWNPSTRFFKQLPVPFDVPSVTQRLDQFGFSYLSANDDYKVVVSFTNEDEYESVVEEKPKMMNVFSSKANIWKTTTEAPLDLHSDVHQRFDYNAVLSNEALHWLDDPGIFAFDLAEEEFRRMPLPIPDGNFKDLIAFRDCLCAFDACNLYTARSNRSMDLWVMETYGVACLMDQALSLGRF